LRRNLEPTSVPLHVDMCEGVRVTGLQGINKQGVIKFTRVYIEKEN